MAIKPRIRKNRPKNGTPKTQAQPLPEAQYPLIIMCVYQDELGELGIMQSNSTDAEDRAIRDRAMPLPAISINQIKDDARELFYTPLHTYVLDARGLLVNGSFKIEPQAQEKPDAKEDQTAEEIEESKVEVAED